MQQHTEPPYLQLLSPENETYIIPLKEKETFTIGRDQDNDLPLHDPQKFVSREHCRLENTKGYFWIIDDDSGASGKPSASGTFVRPVNGGEDVNVQEKGRLRLQDEDMFYLVADVLPPDDTPVFWQFTFYDANTTHNNSTVSSIPPKEVAPIGTLAYSLGSQWFVRSTGDKWEMISLSPKPRRLVRYMAQKNKMKNKPTLCTYAELIDSVWEGDESFGKQNKDITHLVWQIRSKIEDDPSEPKYIKNIMSDGYLLDVQLRP
ncbi:FHA domain-containing protein [Crocosphaera watsonii]|uniref:COG1180: Radical SAM, Pyruvate-formate lyase-activating enzyme like n=3 Tax=Crocosphaera watsonii TaxID=263511 RepID=T2JIN5_CROWT|nr:FHA domain-containing protein [Crocosphaera watsonii]EHJ11508.1 hypothetical protein CWATWH0003_3757 [Crocosphaera watsonii WH 0003]CCQ57407.1 hypothetical protein CWATWH0005_3277 [Crocosphaera watsonii WH 0005]CCQ65135.1 COG1180: Radical SAM, Pyruvate-formate lyase-activating enzyme like [Crocosphaera watsonii WH 0402]